MNMESPRAVDRDNARFLKLIYNSASAKLGIAMAAVGLILAVPCARADAKLSTADTDFIRSAAQGGTTEVKLGEVAAQKGMRDDVKAFGKRMVKDHTAINDDLKALAVQKGVTLPEGLDAEHQGLVDKLSSLTGSQFDDAYIVAMTKGHTKVVKAFKAESAATQDVDVRSFVDKALPVVEEHLKIITAMKK